MKTFTHVKKSVKKKTSVYSQKKLNGFLHVWYEIFWYFETRNRLLKSENLDIPTFESFLLHMRNLKDFFERTRMNIGGSKKTIIKRATKDDDIVSEDYKYKAKRISIGKKIRLKLNQELAHLSYKRNKSNSQNTLWHIEDKGMANFNKNCKDFLKYMKSNFSLHMDFDELDRMYKLSKYIK